jgi:exopolyphosphatase/guanosine-5'-triphosphate,3'-diphosphate pyrophosphatase
VHSEVQNQPEFSEIAAVDLGSNSFRLQFAKVVDGHLIFHDSLREQVKIGAGLGPDKILTEDAQQRAISCLQRFGERLRGLSPAQVRAVATNTFRVAKNAKKFLPLAQQALGFPIEIIAGREEARMIFVGVSHSLYMGCVSYSLRFFADQKLDEANFQRAQIAAASELQSIVKPFSAPVWQEAIGSSGTARTIGEVLRLYGITDGSISLTGMKQLRKMLLEAKQVSKINLLGVSAERASVLPGGLAIMLAVFEELELQAMKVSDSALREGVLYELLGRMQHEDTRELTVNSFMRRYHVDRLQSTRVRKLAKRLLGQLKTHLQNSTKHAKDYLIWAAKLHEIGISIAHNGYHKHSAYIIENADMPGFSRLEQEQLGLLVRAHRRSLNKLEMVKLQGDMQILILIFRLAVLFNRSRHQDAFPEMQIKKNQQGYSLALSKKWLQHNPLTQAELDSEVGFWQAIGIPLKLVDLAD